MGIRAGGQHGMLRKRRGGTPQNFHEGGEMLSVLMSLHAGAGLFFGCFGLP